MKTAKEMFENLGWKQKQNDDVAIIYERGFRSIWFLRGSKTITCSCHMYIEWHKAIHQQVIELGWINE